MQTHAHYVILPIWYDDNVDCGDGDWKIFVGMAIGVGRWDWKKSKGVEWGREKFICMGWGGKVYFTVSKSPSSAYKILNRSQQQKSHNFYI